MRRKSWRRVEYKGPGRRRHASAFDAAEELHDTTIQEWMRDRVEQHLVHGQSPLYHYTSGAGFTGILSSGRFWATHIRDLKDEQELRHAFTIASELVEVAKERVGSRNARAMLAGAKTALTTFEDHFDVYVISLCDRNDLDDMWRRYADQDRGFALEIVPVGNPEESPTREDKPVLICRKVIYNEGLQRQLFNATIERVVGKVEALEQMYGEFGVRHAGKPFSLLLFHLLFDYSATFKRDPYAQEHEWRYLHVVPHESEAARAVKVRMRDGKSIRYVELDLWSQRHGDLKLERCLGGLDCSKEQIAAATQELVRAGRDPVPIEIRRAAR